ncbi:hypothetical protein AB0F17_56320 [Nonomuraea sp. NPDC026600]|uniref:hypothetical protein n=1 Tax=Nonomuraea sp. NPDC026600 TaxID=3155363 RepID=UPI0033C94AF1
MSKTSVAVSDHPLKPRMLALRTFPRKTPSIQGAHAMGRKASPFTFAEGSGRVGAKGYVSADRAVASSQHPTVTETMLEVMHAGGSRC